MMVVVALGAVAPLPLEARTIACGTESDRGAEFPSPLEGREAKEPKHMRLAR